MTMKQTKPERKLSLGQLDGSVILQTMNLNGKTFAWLDEDDRYLTTVDGIDRFEESAKAWFAEWFNVRPEHQIKLKVFDSSLGSTSQRTFVIQVRRIPKVSA